MSNQTTEPKSNGGVHKYMLHELARKVALVHCQQRDEAVAVQDGDLAPPAEWRPELEARQLAFVEYELANALERIDSDDLFVAATRLAAPSTSWEFEAWKRCNPTWPKQIARVRKKMRKEYEVEKRKTLENRAADIIAGLIADERKREATNQICVALRSTMMDLGSTVRATPESGERRQLDRAELTEATIDHVNNKLEIRGRWWCHVEVDWSDRQAAAVPMLPATKARATSPYGRPKRTGIKPDKRDALKDWIREKFPAGIPAGTKNDVVLMDFAAEKNIQASEKTLRRALDELAIEANGN